MTVLYADSNPGHQPGRYPVSTHHDDGTPGPDIIIVVEDGHPDRWELA